jgi:hypothetical protein
LLDIDEVLLQEENMLAIQAKCFHSVKFMGLFAIALLYDSMCALSDLVSNLVLVVEERSVFIF